MSVHSAEAPGSGDPVLDQFTDSLWLEDGLAPATLQSYRRDLRQFSNWLQKRHDKRLVDATHGELLGYLAHRFAVGARPSSSARSLSSLRRFYQYALRQGMIADAQRGCAETRACTAEDLDRGRS
jgi:integrase/recombinase XerD